MRKLLVVIVVFAGFAGLVGAGAVAGLLGSMGQGGQQNYGCGSDLGPSTGGSGDGQRAAAKLTPEAQGIAKQIIEVGKQRQLPPRAWQVAIQAGATESRLSNVLGGDRDSLGVFQMRPSKSWGTPAQVTNVDYAINKFYDVLHDTTGWESMRPGTAAQEVESSGFPLRYHQWESMAAHLVSVQGEIGGGECEPAAPAGGGAAQAIDYANDQLGKPYVWGAAGPAAFDCSGLMQQAWKTAGADIPKYSRAQYQQGGSKVPMAQAQPGDLVFWGYGRDPSAIHHVAMYLGDNEVLQAPQPGESVERTKMWDSGELLPMVVRPAPGGAVAASG